MENVNCLNPWDPQSKRQYGIDGVYAALNAGHAIGGQAHGICYCIEGNTVDRASRKNGRGWCEDVSPTLNTQDHHAICFAWSNSSSAELSASEKSPTIKATSCGEPAVVFAIDQQGGKGNCNFAEDVMPTLLSDSHGTPHALCFQLSGDRDNPSVSTCETAYCIPANPMSDRGQALCYRK